jgi:single-strand DNA-binding protein
MQQITVAGRLSADAETREVQSNTVTSFNLAVDQGWGDKKVTNWYRVSVWGKKGSGAAPYLLKGSQVTVVGELEIGEYNGKQQLNIRASDFTMPAKPSGQRNDGPRHENQSGFGGGNAPRGGGSMDNSFGGGSGFDNDLDDDVPFITMGGNW